MPLPQRADDFYGLQPSGFFRAPCPARVRLANVVYGADVGVIQSGCGLGFAPEAGEDLRVTGKFLGQKFERDQTVKPRIFGFVDHAHTAAAQPFQNAVVRHGLANHCQGMLRGENTQSGLQSGYPSGLRRLPFAGVEFPAAGKLPEGPFTTLGCARGGTGRRSGGGF